MLHAPNPPPSSFPFTLLAPHPFGGGIFGLVGVPLFGREAQIRPSRTRVVGGGRVSEGAHRHWLLVGREAADSPPLP